VTGGAVALAVSMLSWQGDAVPRPAVSSVTLPAPEGPYAVGFWETAIQSTRPDLLSPDPLDRRELLLQVWYPAGTAAGAAKPYVTPEVAASLVSIGLPASIAGIRTHSVRGALRLPGRLPLVLLSHGLSWPGVLYQSFAEDLASRGYVAAVVTHPHAAVGVQYPDGRVKDMSLWPKIADERDRQAFLAEHVAVWVDDLTEVLDLCERWARGEGTGPLRGAVDAARMAVAGHSLGGTAAARMLGDSRVKGAIALEGKARPLDGASQPVAGPFMHVMGGYNRLELEGAGSLYEPTLGAPIFEIIVNGAWHASFSDFVFVYKPSADEAWRARHRYELEPGRVLTITRDYIAAFLQRIFDGRSHAVLQPVSYAGRVDRPAASRYPEVELTIYVR
jgi:dienelactone hydrolase